MKLILACTPNGGIGYQNKLPWTNIQGDLHRFKSLTYGHTIIMGRNTWDSLPKKPLPNRINVVVTSRPFEQEGVKCISSIDDHSDFYWLIGGAKLIQDSWQFINEVHLTKVYAEYTCDTFVDLSYLTDNFEKIRSTEYTDHEYQIWKRK